MEALKPTTNWSGTDGELIFKLKRNTLNIIGSWHPTSDIPIIVRHSCSLTIFSRSLSLMCVQRNPHGNHVNLFWGSSRMFPPLIYW